MSQRMIKQGEHACGAELLRMAWQGDAENVVPGALYRRGRLARGTSIAVGAGYRRWYFSRVESALTDVQRETLDWLCQFIDRCGYSPSVREAGKAFGITTNAVNDRLTALIRKGYIQRDPGRARGLTVLKDASERPNADWRARAIAAEARVAELEAEVETLLELVAA